jgi:CRP-like cAMP-binding protein
MYQLVRNIDICHMDINEILDRIYPLPQASKAAVKNCIVDVEYSKGHLLFKAGKIESNIYFLKKGIVRAYSDAGDNEVTFWFGKEGDTVISMKNYVAGEKGYENIELLEDGEFYKVKTGDLQKLFLEDIHIANWGRKFAEHELIIAEEKLIARQFRTASERYKTLLNDSPDLIQRVQLGHIASFLGITQVSLSRIRAEIK